jgi:hypothetical protein
MKIAPAETSAPAQTGTELALLPALPAIVPADFFKPNGSQEILEGIKAAVRAQAAQLDISTEPRRAKIASLAYAVAKDKNRLDDEGKNLVAATKEAIKAIDKERGRVWDEMEALQKEVRQPLTDWENAEKERIGNHEAALKLIQEAAVMPALHTPADVEARIASLDKIASRPWEEFRSRADLTYATVKAALKDALESAQHAEAERVELARLRQEEADRKEAARVQAIADEAAAKERRAAEERVAEVARAAEQERKRIELERAEAEAKAKQEESRRIESERQAVLERERAEREAKETEERLQRQLERERIEAEERRIKEAEYAEQKRIAAEQETERQLKLAEERRKADEQAAIVRAREAEARADREKAAAIQAERDRVAQEALKVAEEAERRAKNRAHQASVNRDILAALASLNIAEEAGKIIIAAIAKGAVPHVTINY